MTTQEIESLAEHLAYEHLGQTGSGAKTECFSFNRMAKMTATTLKALIEPTQDGAKFAIREGFTVHKRASDPLTAYIESAIDDSSEVSEVREKLAYAVIQLNAAMRCLDRLDELERIERWRQ